MAGQSSPARLSKRSATILRQIAAGHSYEQIVDSGRGITYVHIFAAAEQALRALGHWGEAPMRPPEPDPRAPNAYAPWLPKDDRELLAAVRAGRSVRELAVQFGRRPSAIQSRLNKLLPQG
jgi:DNA-binding CsgD family transcriptional regulator